jgi:cholesterol transport system auxiliary component
LKNSVKSSFTASVATLALLAGCATPQAPVAKAVYDFGPVLTEAAVPAASAGATSSAGATGVSTSTLALADVEAHSTLEGTSVVYRLAYADAQQLRPYTLARWSVPPAQLLRLRLRDALATRGPVLGTTEGAVGWLLRVELDEFSQVFDAPATSSGLVRLRATLLQAGKLVAQRSVLTRAPAPSADAAGGVRALTAATDDAVQQLGAWVAQQMQTPTR